ncbi:MAG TPA: class I SAM-dependent methyltransferase [Candidatus Binataceae bacterium]|nr:class I SAM-dependent methyltransferase [Candidatus Binataceae bacterium]
MTKTPRIEIIDTREGYDRWSEIYDLDGNPLIALEEKHFPEILGEVRGLRIADIGCGTGRHAARLAASGARVIAIDFSAGMIRRAREKFDASEVAFAAADISRTLPTRDRSFDRVICCLVLDHIHDVASLFRELKRICKVDGVIAISVMHPAMMLREVQAQFHDPLTGATVRPRSAPNQVSDYVNAATAAGLRIDDMSEHVVDAELAREFPRAMKYLGWPMLLLMRLLP